MPPVTLLRAKDDAAKFGLEPDKLLELKEKAMGARGRAYCMFMLIFSRVTDHVYSEVFFLRKKGSWYQGTGSSSMSIGF